MKTILIITLTLITGFLLGWLANEFVKPLLFTRNNTGNNMTTSTVINEPFFSQTNEIQSNNSEYCNCSDSNNFNYENITDFKSTESEFIKRLGNYQFFEAVALFKNISHHGDPQQSKLKKYLISFLNSLLAEGKDEAFIELTDIYLIEFYDDIDILLSLAKFNQKMRYYWEVVNLLQRIRAYAYKTNDLIKIDDFYNNFIAIADANLIEQTQTGELIYLYNYIENVGLLTEPNKLRLAELYIIDGDDYLGREHLIQLLANPQLKEKAQEILDNLDLQNPDFVEQQDKERMVFTDKIPLIKKGAHYLVSIQISDNKVNLIIDTGASITTLMKTSFDQIKGNINYKELGSRMFNTANGISKGKIYNIDQLQLGEFTFNNIDISVLDFQIGNNADGLLGMNTLRYFRFEIDQENSTLLLKQR
ncbi:MAG: hypothetical protein GY829_01160 [Gammaproteobacteria bacterium]|nr:hypothetical protein [Gammaproteobacteria bacterium]